MMVCNVYISYIVQQINFFIFCIINYYLCKNLGLKYMFFGKFEYIFMVNQKFFCFIYLEGIFFFLIMIDM